MIYMPAYTRIYRNLKNFGYKGYNGYKTLGK